MGKTVSKFTGAFGSVLKSVNNAQNSNKEQSQPNSPPWDATIDQLFGDAPPDENLFASSPAKEPPKKPKRRRRPPPPPSRSNRRLQKTLSSSPLTRRSRRQGAPHRRRTPIIPEIPRRVATGRSHTTNGSFNGNRRPAVVPKPIGEHNIPTKVARTINVNRRPSSRRRKRSSQRTQHIQELLQCPVCLTSFTEPRLLPCGHTYCHECLNRLIQDDNDIVICPECRKQHLVPEDGMFPPNFVVRNLLEEQGMPTGPRRLPSGNHFMNVNTMAKCTTCERIARLRQCRHCSFMVCERCLRTHRYGSNTQNEFSKRAKILSGKVIQLYVAVRKVNRSHSQVKRLMIEMPIGNYIRDTCETLIRRIADREELQSSTNELVLEFGDKRLAHQRTLASYGVQNGDLLFLFNPDQRLNFPVYEDDKNISRSSLLFNRENTRLRSDSYNSSISDIRTTTSNDTIYNHSHYPLSTISDEDDNDSALYNES